MTTGLVFSVEEFAIYDGPGIRTTVFLKGCPLRCMWCHSPEGQSFNSEILRSPNGCIKCNACIQKGIDLTGKPEPISESIPVCPRNLLREAGERYTSTALIEKLKKNVPLLNARGGGITFSGGEPLAQPTFLIDCLHRLEGVTHRAVQTSGFCDPTTFSEMLRVSDYILFDLKLMDPQKHLFYCGQSNEKILKNYRLLAASGKPFCTRIPLIPTVNDTEENLLATAQFMKENGVSAVELLPYHKMTGSKYALCGKAYEPTFDESAIPNPHLEIFKSKRIEVNIL